MKISLLRIEKTSRVSCTLSDICPLLQSDVCPAWQSDVYPVLQSDVCRVLQFDACAVCRFQTRDRLNLFTVWSSLFLSHLTQPYTVPDFILPSRRSLIPPFSIFNT